MKLLPASRGPRSNGTLLALSGWAIALLAWTYADGLQAEHQALEQRLAPLAGRSAALRAADVSVAEQAASAAGARRAATERRLRVEQSEQLMRATVLYDLRSACAAAGVKVCTVRLSEVGPTAALAADRPKAAASAPGTLDALGIGRARAIVSGTLVSDELDQMFATLRGQRDAVWRINGFTVRTNTFEIDIERHFIAPASALGSTS